MKKFNKDIGFYSENLAKSYLIQKKYYILECNFRNRLGELDIICTKDNILIIVEVKGRYSNDYGFPKEAVDFSKQRSIIKVTESYILYKKLTNVNVRFDVIEIHLNSNNDNFKVNHIKDAFRL